jgi:hypothetical protein
VGFRYRKSIKIARGVRVNLTGRGFSSFSFGGRGATLNMSGRGVRQTVSLPGSGLSYSSSRSGSSAILIGALLTGLVALIVYSFRGNRAAQLALGLLVLGVGGVILEQSATKPTLTSPTAYSVTSSVATIGSSPPWLQPDSLTNSHKAAIVTIPPMEILPPLTRSPTAGDLQETAVSKPFVDYPTAPASSSSVVARSQEQVGPPLQLTSGERTMSALTRGRLSETVASRNRCPQTQSGKRIADCKGARKMGEVARH